MICDIVWRTAAFEQMAELVRLFPDRATAFSAALRHLNAMLRRNPDSEGESREDPYRVAFFGGLTVYYRANHSTRIVTIVSVHMPPDRIEPPVE